MRFLVRWQHGATPWRVRDEGGLLEIIEQLQGFEAASGAWESEILPLRVVDYSPATLDDLSLSGEVAWGRFSRRRNDVESQVLRGSLSRNVPISLAPRESLPWILKEPDDGVEELKGAAGEVLTFLTHGGASFMQDVVGATQRLPSEVENALWQLAAAGLVTSDGFTTVRGLVNGSTKKAQKAGRFRRRPRTRRQSSRWSILQANSHRDDAVEARSFQLLHRYGVVFPELLAREPMAPRWRELLQVYRRAEAKGEIRGGRFVAGFVGEQFALPEAIETLRSVRKAELDGRLAAISACDPLNLTGIVTPGARVPALLGNRLVLRNAVPLASLQSGEIHYHSDVDEAERSAIHSVLGGRPAAAFDPDPTVARVS